jgi:ATP-dependent DNA helicase RecQ
MQKQALTYLRQAVGNSEARFRPGQWPCIEALLQQKKLLVVQRTGWGKSMVYFVATKLLRERGSGVTLLISPLLALMRNQMAAARGLNIRAETINSSNQDDWDGIELLLADNQVDLLLISPERLANDAFRTKVLEHIADRVGLFVVDEAHCISDWGHDFRPDYRRIVRVLQALPSNIPVLATTATANDRVIRDVASQLGNLQVQRGPLVRDSLMLQNITLPSPAARLAWLANNLPLIDGSGIIYTLTIRDAERVAEWLQHKGLNVQAYHANLANELRLELEEKLLANHVKALAATVALGMGFDKPDLGFVIHFQRPGSIVHYYQQVGRAGRALEQAYGIMLCGAEDEEITDYFIRSAFPPEAQVTQILEALENAPDGLSIPALEAQVNLRHGQIEKVIKLLSVEHPSPLVKQGSKWYATPVEYTLDQAKIDRLTDVRRAEQGDMLDYISTRDCLMGFLARKLDDPQAGACGRCANCQGGPLLPMEVRPETANEAGLFLKRSHQIIQPRKSWPSGQALPEHGFKGRIAADLQAEEGRALSIWGDAGWGALVRKGRNRDERFSDDLVEGCLQLLRTWQPSPAPTWLTCVPSIAHPDLVPDFTRRLAASLGLRFVPAVEKIRDNPSQRDMENSFQQAHNLDGVFYINQSRLYLEPVILVDDLIDSGWTFTVTAALLRRAGLPGVYPLALALASPRLG